MASAIKCISCQQRVNIAEVPGQTIVCPMCKTPQKIDENGQVWPAEMPSGSAPGQPTGSAQSFESDRRFDDDSRSSLDEDANSGFCLIIGCGLGLLLLFAAAGIAAFLLLR